MTRSREIQTPLWAPAGALAIIAAATWWRGRHPQTEPPGSGTAALYVELDRGAEGSAVYRLPPGSTARDLFRAAGIAAPSRWDPSRPLENGRLYRLEGDGGHSESWMSGERLLALGIPIPLNECSREDLVAIPGIGDATAVRILERRASLGRFQSYREVAEVPGVGPKTMELLTRHTRL